MSRDAPDAAAAVAPYGGDMTTSSHISPAAQKPLSLPAIVSRALPAAIVIALLTGICVAWHVLIGMALGSLR